MHAENRSLVETSKSAPLCSSDTRSHYLAGKVPDNYGKKLRQAVMVSILEYLIPIFGLRCWLVTAICYSRDRESDSSPTADIGGTTEPLRRKPIYMYNFGSNILVWTGFGLCVGCWIGVLFILSNYYHFSNFLNQHWILLVKMSGMWICPTCYCCKSPVLARSIFEVHANWRN